MLNISNKSVAKHFKNKSFSALTAVENKLSGKVFRRISYITLLLIFLILLLPWTQNIRSNGRVTTLKPEQRPQSLHSAIGGQIEKWYVQEGDFVEKGDTILKLTEIKDAYFDPKLLARTSDQVELKKQLIGSYEQKIGTQDQRLTIIDKQRDLKLAQAKIYWQQAQLKVQNDSIAHVASLIKLKTAAYQYARQDSLYRAGLKSLSDLETRNLSYQQAQANELSAKNNWLNSKNEVLRLRINMVNLEADFANETNKTQSEKLASISSKLDSETNLSKLENEYSNYEQRINLYYVTAPQAGYITQTTSSGIGETIKEGQEILTIMPEKYDLAIEVYIEPIDLPLVKKGVSVRIQFDGWPAIVFAGWPQASHGTYGGKIYAIDQFIGKNGKYRVLVQPDKKDYPWPEAIRYGSGTSTMMLLSDVPVWYELWRKINGFPPEFYTDLTSSK